MLDQRVRAHDWNMLNNRESRRQGVEFRLDDPTRETVRRDRLVAAVLPLAWSNDYGGVTIGYRGRENYLGRLSKDIAVFSAGLAGKASDRWGVYARWANPVRHPMPRSGAAAAFWRLALSNGAAVTAT